MTLEDFDAFKLANKFFQSCEKINTSKHLKDQLHRASSSIVLNVAEGFGKNTPLDRKRYYSIARGSFQESRAILIMTNTQHIIGKDVVDRLGAILYRLVNPK